MLKTPSFHCSGHGVNPWLGELNCLPLQLMNLCGLPFVCFPGVRINERSCASAVKERGKEKDAEMGRPGEVMEPWDEIY